MIINIVFNYVLPQSSVSSQDFYCSLTRGQSRNVTDRFRVSVILQCTSFRVYASSFCLLFLRLCSIVIGVLTPSWFTEILI